MGFAGTNSCVALHAFYIYILRAKQNCHKCKVRKKPKAALLEFIEKCAILLVKPIKLKKDA